MDISAFLVSLVVDYSGELFSVLLLNKVSFEHLFATRSSNHQSPLEPWLSYSLISWHSVRIDLNGHFSVSLGFSLQISVSSTVSLCRQCSYDP